MASTRGGRLKGKSRIPGVPVVDDVNTPEGKKKKVCFKVGGKWFFRMASGPEVLRPGGLTRSLSANYI